MALTIKNEVIVSSGNAPSFSKFLDERALDTDITLTYASGAISGSSNYRYNYTLSYTPVSGIEQENHLKNADDDIHVAAKLYK